MVRGALVRLQARNGSRTSDKLPSLACRASASIAGYVRKSLLRLRPSAYLTRDHRLVSALPPCRRTNRVSSEAGEPTGAREHVCGPGVILTVGVKGAREGARVKIMQVGRPQTAGRASRSGAGLAIGQHPLAQSTQVGWAAVAAVLRVRAFMKILSGAPSSPKRARMFFSM